jgi:septation ring formation regulator EzrA
MIISKSFKYDDKANPKCHDWVLKQDNFSKAVRRLIEGEAQRQDNLEQIKRDLADLRKEINRLKAGGLAQSEQAQVLEIGEVVEAIAEQPEVKVNVAALRNRYKD